MIAYLFKLILASAILYGFYYLFLRQERIFHFNRFYLLLILPLSLILPQLTVKTSYVEVPAVYQAPIESSRPIASSFDLPNNSTKAVTTTPTAAPPLITWQESLATLFILISACLLVRLIRNLVRLRQFRNSGEVIQEGKHTLCLREDISSSFTFLNTIFTNKTEFKAGKLPKEILAHEAIHAAQKHSVDIILMELLNVFLWFNPVLYLIKQSIKLNHEFLADNGVYTKHNSIPQYQQTLLHYAKINANNEPLLASRLTYGETKKRLKIMVKSTNKHITRAKVTLAFIAIAATAFFLGRERVVAQFAEPLKHRQLFNIEGDSIRLGEKLIPKVSMSPSTKLKYITNEGTVREAEYGNLSKNELERFASPEADGSILIIDKETGVLKWTNYRELVDGTTKFNFSLDLIKSNVQIEQAPPAPLLITLGSKTWVKIRDKNNNWISKGYNDLTLEDRMLMSDSTSESYIVIPPAEQMQVKQGFIDELSGNLRYKVWVNNSLIENSQLKTYDLNKFHHYYRVDVRQKDEYPDIDFLIVFKTKDYWWASDEPQGKLYPFPLKWRSDFEVIKEKDLEKINSSIHPHTIVRFTNENEKTVEKKFSELSEADQTKFKAGDFKNQQFFLPPPPPAYISEEMLNEFANNDKYQVWLNDKQVAPKSLKDYSPNDFHHYRKIPLNNISKTRIVFITQDHWKNSGLANGTWVNYLVIKDNEPNKKENPEPQEPTNRFPAYIFHDNSKIRKLDKTGRVIENDGDVEVAKVQFFIPPTKAKPVTSKELEKLLSNENYTLWVNNTLVKDKSNLAIAPSQIHHTQDISEGQQHFVNLITTDYSELDKIENGFWLTIPESYADEFIPKYLETEDKKDRKQEANIQGRKNVKDLPQEYLTEIEESAKPQNGQHEMVIPTNLVVMFKSIEGNWIESKINQLSEEEFSYFQTPAAKAHIYSTHMGMTTPSQFPLQALGNDNWKVYVNDVAINKSEYKLFDFEKDFVKAVPNAPAPNHPDYIENVSQVAFYTDDYPKLEELKGDGWIRLDYLPGKKVFKSPSE
ncbi:beta-lactamase regulating signal transducer with metallopeptidase domain [Roseivirga pacifica]|uniref:Signal transducer regulating beta-lactamase production, contains metallopeptidase domain n=1 Tax=Roseivirga pacifica TaxID=1267423 RepID=A0A1I0QTU4_9BACT|nr:M56 family metallopeptidase [Roseivirga pacifica]RKQ42576.1 beta-lactamase regulating signal transducer with metallopeptidase domain [Roseivirga pacifica]SEW30820.1 Signal transducer regulating beta-lactamase production, contains metallopeptidase domain [Roseivirga pacifica]